MTHHVIGEALSDPTDLTVQCTKCSWRLTGLPCDENGVAAGTRALEDHLVDAHAEVEGDPNSVAPVTLTLRFAVPSSWLRELGDNQQAVVDEMMTAARTAMRRTLFARLDGQPQAWMQSGLPSAGSHSFEAPGAPVPRPPIPPMPPSFPG